MVYHSHILETFHFACGLRHPQGFCRCLFLPSFIFPASQQTWVPGPIFRTLLSALTLSLISPCLTALNTSVYIDGNQSLTLVFICICAEYEAFPALPVGFPIAMNGMRPSSAGQRPLVSLSISPFFSLPKCYVCPVSRCCLLYLQSVTQMLLPL